MTSSKYPPVSHVIFDLDGTLIDTEKYFNQVLNSVIGEYGGKPMSVELSSKTSNLNLLNSAPIIIDQLRLPCTSEEFIESIQAHFKRNISREVDGIGIQFMPGAKRLVAHLATHQIPMAICTATTKKIFKFKMRHFGDYFKPRNIFNHVVVGGGGDPKVTQNKPHPDPYLAAIRRFRGRAKEKCAPQPKQVLVFEDTSTGLLSAITAGTQTVFVQADPNVDLGPYVSPTVRVTSLEDFKPEEFGLPPFTDQ